MSIRAIYENGVLKPLEELSIKEGTEVTVDIHLIEERKEISSKRKSVKDFAAYGMWKDRTDCTDGVDYVNKIRKYRVVPTNPEIGQLAYNIMKSHAKANGLDPCDAMIATTAIYEGLKLSTQNEKHFRNIEALEIEVPGY